MNLTVPGIIFAYWFTVLIIRTNAQKIANEKCREYSKAVYQKTDQIFSLRTSTNQQFESTCAIFENPLIVGGTPARSREFPHMAVIGFGPQEESELDWLCGGSLISENHVLTAAHCTVSQSGPPQKVKLGTTNLIENDDYVQHVPIDKFINHPQYKRPRKYHDLAVLFLKQAVKFSAFVRPACLNTLQENNYSQATATGFGKTKHTNIDTNQVLLKVDLDLIPNSNCSRYLKFRRYEMPQNLIKEMMCAGYLKGGKDTCQGDSGGPLQILLEEPYCMYSIIGITSFGRFCGMSYSPGVYTRVDQYIPWIETTIWK